LVLLRQGGVYAALRQLDPSAPDGHLGLIYHLSLRLDINRNGSQGNDSKEGRYLLVNFVSAVDKNL